MSFLDMRLSKEPDNQNKRENASQVTLGEPTIPARNVTGLLPKPNFESGFASYADQVFPSPPDTRPSWDLTDPQDLPRIETKFEFPSPNTPHNSISSDSENSSGIQISPGILEECARDSYPDELEKFKKWIKSAIRRLEMLHDLYKRQNSTNPYEDNYPELVETKIRHLTQLQGCLARRNAARKTYFLLAFDLERYLSNTPSSLIISNPTISANLCTLLQNWLQNSCFSISNYNHLKRFLKVYFKDGVIVRPQGNRNPSIFSVINSWKTSLFYDERRENMINGKRNIMKALFFSVLIDRFEADLEEAAFPLESLLKLGQKDVKYFTDFLSKYEIPFSGPFKNSDAKNPRLTYFISDLNPSDAIVNNYVPLYGSYMFNLTALQMDTHQSHKLWDTLDQSPAWLLNYPPLFVLEIDALTEQIARLP